MKFTIPGAPFGKQRHRTATIGNRSRSYTPEKTVNYENLVKLLFQQAANGFYVESGPVLILIRSYYPIPKSVSQKRANLMRTGKIRPTIKPDYDNIGKIVGDALNGIAYRDDAQVVDGHVIKYYSDLPRVEVTIEEVSTDEGLLSL